MSVSATDKYGPLGALDSTLEVAIGGYGTVGLQVSGTWVGTITFEGTVDRGTWQTLSVTLTNSSTRVTTTTGNGIWVGSVAGLLAVRLRMSSYVSGTAQAKILGVGTGGGSSGGGGGTGSDVNLIEVGGSSIALGQAAMAAAIPVVVASDQTPIPVAGSFSSSAVGPTGDPVPADADFIGFQEPGGDLEGFQLESFDYDTGAGTQNQTAIGLVTPASGGPTPVLGGHGTAAGALRVELPTDGTGIIATVGAVTAITNALPAGTNAIGKLAANSGVDIGDVDVTSVIPGTGATNLGKAEDGGHTSGDVGVFALGVRNDTPNAALTNADADYSQISTTKTGAVQIQYSAEDFAVLGSNFVNKPFNLTGAQTDTIIWSPAAGKRWYVTSFYYCVSAAATVTFEDDTSGGDVFMGIGGEHAANSGAACASLRTPLFSTEDAADLLLTTSAGNIRGFVSGYEI